MATLTLKQVPEELLERLREVARTERRSLNQQVLHLLEHAVAERSSFVEALARFRAGSTPEEVGDAFEDLRARDTGRDVSL